MRIKVTCARYTRNGRPVITDERYFTSPDEADTFAYNHVYESIDNRAVLDVLDDNRLVSYVFLRRWVEEPFSKVHVVPVYGYNDPYSLWL